jgi:hypothetical protein
LLVWPLTKSPTTRGTTHGEYLLFIELIRAASAPDVADRIKGMSLANCKFANVVVLSYDKLVAQLDCSTPEDGTRVVLEELPKVDGVVQTNVIAVVKPVQH